MTTPELLPAALPVPWGTSIISLYIVKGIGIIVHKIFIILLTIHCNGYNGIISLYCEGKSMIKCQDCIVGSCVSDCMLVTERIARKMEKSKEKIDYFAYCPQCGKDIKRNEREEMAVLEAIRETRKKWENFKPEMRHKCRLLLWNSENCSLCCYYRKNYCGAPCGKCVWEGHFGHCGDFIFKFLLAKTTEEAALAKDTVIGMLLYLEEEYK